MAGQRFRIGRASDNDIVIPEHQAQVSRHHAVVTVYPDGAMAIEDLGTANGVFINGHQIHGETRLVAADRVLFGSYPFDLSCLFQPAQSPPPSPMGARMVRIGRDPSNDIVVNMHQTQVGRQHAEIAISDRGHMTIRDLGTKNGVKVAGRLITGPTPIVPGDDIRLGSFRLDTRELTELVGGRAPAPPPASEGTYTRRHNAMQEEVRSLRSSVSVARWMVVLVLIIGGAVVAAVLATGRGGALSTEAFNRHAELRTVQVVAYDRRDRAIGGGTAFFIARDMLITNHHVIGVRRARRFRIRNATQTLPLEVQVEAAESKVDLALLRLLEPDRLHQDIRDMKRTQIGEEVRKLTRVIAVGYPSVDLVGKNAAEKLVPRSTSGKIQSVKGEGGLIEHSADVRKGNSGGPLFNACGHVVGVNVAIVRIDRHKAPKDDWSGTQFYSISAKALREFLKRHNFQAADPPRSCKDE